jgi:hypothetical protein
MRKLLAYATDKPSRSPDPSIYPILPAALWPWGLVTQHVTEVPKLDTNATLRMGAKVRWTNVGLRQAFAALRETRAANINSVSGDEH